MEWWNPTGHLEPSPSESSDSDIEMTKDLENSLLMRSLLDPSSPTFFDRPLADSLFSDEDTDKNNAPAEPPAPALEEDDDAEEEADEEEAEDEEEDEEAAAAAAPAPAEAAEGAPAVEGIKLRLKLEKSEPTAVNYVAFVNVPAGGVDAPAAAGAGAAASAGGGGTSPAEPRVPPLHISLKGRNLTVLSPKKEGKKKKVRPRHQSPDEDDDFHRGEPSHSVGQRRPANFAHSLRFFFVSVVQQERRRLSSANGSFPFRRATPRTTPTPSWRRRWPTTVPSLAAAAKRPTPSPKSKRKATKATPPTRPSPNRRRSARRRPQWPPPKTSKRCRRRHQWRRLWRHQWRNRLVKCPCPVQFPPPTPPM